MATTTHPDGVVMTTMSMTTRRWWLRRGDATMTYLLQSAQWQSRHESEIYYAAIQLRRRMNEQGWNFPCWSRIPHYWCWVKCGINMGNSIPWVWLSCHRLCQQMPTTADISWIYNLACQGLTSTTEYKLNIIWCFQNPSWIWGENLTWVF